ncbi:hypothetical protein G9C98_004812 [Cotesia typhae]|uniref:CAF1B/HIR1 beta-propeller domain-containing protein n=1 Tax=Cotesia typhae TaxID=2053667 RepID=A0A8J5QXG7_9HYME|nr:hypothetical protein G9C98_004812 [Cotesia typhae]
MKCTIPEISWHNRDPVLSVDVQQCKLNKDDKTDKIYWRLATGGADSHVLIWHVKINELGLVLVNCVADLNQSIICLWMQKEGTEPPPLPGEENLNEEQWTSWKILRGHLEDVYDLSWSPDNNMLVSGSVDNTAIVWDVQKGRTISILQDYKGFVQGVTWDPCNQYIATLSTDRQCRLIDVNSLKTIQRVSKSKIPTPPGHPLENKTIRLFYDDTFKSFFRRLTFTVDGSLIIAPSGIIESPESTDRLSNSTIIFSRNNIKESSDGRILVVSSTDGYCSIIHFQEGELGKVYTANEPISINSLNGSKLNERSEAKETNKQNVGQKKACFLPDVNNEAMDVDAIKSIPDNMEDTEDIKLVYNEASYVEPPIKTTENIKGNDKTARTTPPKIDKPKFISAKTPRRVQLITISSPKRFKDKQ